MKLVFLYLESIINKYNEHIMNAKIFILPIVFCAVKCISHIKAEGAKEISERRKLSPQVHILMKLTDTNGLNG